MNHPTSQVALPVLGRAVVPLNTTNPAAQGDVLVLAWPPSIAPTERAAAIAKTEPIPPTGRTVLVGATHSHTLHTIPDPAATWTPARPSDLTLGVLVVPPDGLAVLGHPDHGDLHIGPGMWVLRRQRVQTLPATWPPPAPEPEPDPGYAAWAD